MKCPDCRDRLSLVASTEFKDAPHIIDHQWFRCVGCGERFFAVLTEDKTHIFEDDFMHVGYRVAVSAWETTRRAPDRCPKPRDERCPCGVHAMIRGGSRAWKEL